ncbi:hypothetical protein F0562_023919 [Nyssa sinensis]|uniref:S-adenosylmethionine-dependent methyltransferase n=1 Tax=Nyssa sinensis TaxID=561372 RepID=A0A5J5BLR6_9ASTE|nr:hypothetical protein F0562_023919 [Nyssa sinensis]
MNNITEAVEHKYQAQGHLEFQVFFNDRVSNDFNTLSINLPPNRKYFAAAVPGSFYGRLFPKASINFIFSSFAVQWLSKLPQVVCDLNSPSCNKGRILYANAPKEVGEAYSAQYAEDTEKFLGARAQELVSGGLMALLILGRVNGTLPAQSSLGPRFQPLESCLVDMTNEGLLSKDKLDSFNLPIYSPSSEELEKLIEKTGCFDTARVEEMHETIFHYSPCKNSEQAWRELSKHTLGVRFWMNCLIDMLRKLLDVLLSTPVVALELHYSSFKNASTDQNFLFLPSYITFIEG